MSAKWTTLPLDFSGVVRLFPLPNLVMFPHVVQPLHIFEPRYCDLLEEAVATDQLITMALLQPGWEPNYAGRPALEEVACIGRIISHARLTGNRHDLLLLGLHRARIAYELPVTAGFRRARVELLDDEVGDSSFARQEETRLTLSELFRQIVPQNDQSREQLDQLLNQELELGVLADIIAFTATLDAPIKQELLEELNVDRRSKRLIQVLQDALKRPELMHQSAERDFPPRFSAN